MVIRTKYSAFTLIEMLLVMAIFMIIFGIGISAFSGLRTTIQMNQRVEDFKQNIRWVQRSASLLKREPGENWVYGIGLDLRYLYDIEEYGVFKWCAYGSEFNTTNHAKSLFPAHLKPPQNGSYDLTTSGRLPFNDTSQEVEYLDGDFCDPLFLPANQPLGKLALLPTSGTGVVAGNGPQGQWLIDKPLRVGYDSTIPDRASVPAFVLFESVTGNVFFYRENGSILNYLPDGSPVANVRDFRFVIATPDGERGQMIVVAHDSGKVTVTPVNSEQIQSDFVFIPPLGSDEDTDTEIDPPWIPDPPVTDEETDEDTITPPPDIF